MSQRRRGRILNNNSRSRVERFAEWFSYAGEPFPDLSLLEGGKGKLSGRGQTRRSLRERIHGTQGDRSWDDEKSLVGS